MANPFKHERGNIMITVLWVIVTMALLVLGLSYEARSDIERTALYRDRAKAYWYARAAIERVKYDYAQSKLRADEEFQAKAHYRYEFPDGYAECLLKSTSALMSVNSKNREMWQQLFKYYGLDQDQADSIVNAIFDWTDEDDDYNNGTSSDDGAESDYYQTLSPPYQPRNSPFFSVDELLLVRGVTETMFYGTTTPEGRKPGLVELLSDRGKGAEKFDINTAPPGILMAFLEITEEEAQVIIQRRNEKLFLNVQEAGSEINMEAADNLNRFFFTDRGNNFIIRATGHVTDSAARYTVQNEVSYIGSGKLFRTLNHKDFVTKHVDEMQPEEMIDE